jgi:homoserine kinase
VTTIRVPASTSNLGAGFDTLGLALEIYLEVEVEAVNGEEEELVVEGEGAGEIATSRENRIHRAYRLAAARASVEAPPVRFRARNEIPLARGLGSSAAAAVAGLTAFEVVAGHELGRETLLACCRELEGHLDNAAASLDGGFVTVCVADDERTYVVRREWPDELRVVVVLPDVGLETAAARRVLPASYPRADAVFNLQRVALFHAAVAERRWELLGEAMRDRLHQPYREALVPGAKEAFTLAPDLDLVGVAMSGAGSGVVALARNDVERAAARVEACFAARGVATRTLHVGVDRRGRRLLT